MKSFRIKPENLNQWKSSLHQFEEHFTYPLGGDSFSIDHGDNYLAFFQRMGNAHLYAMEKDDQIIAVGAGIIHHRFKAWYLCDMKVHPDHRGHQIPVKMFRKYFLPCYFKSQKGFALNMEDPEGKKNPIAKIMQTLPWTPLKEGARILFYYEDAEKTLNAMKVLKSSRPNISFSSLKGVKDLVLKSSQTPIPLMHMEWNEKTAGGEEKPRPDHLHMWCLDEKSDLNKSLSEIGIKSKASGLIFHHRLSHLDWNELRTSEL